ncbi:hypothetical protein [Ferruginibacter albus]|uniref:hypothetical protein n=1 Tax=Ferruginibacter albus TaxID=2875540 RepID=UPI001CC7FA6C|nr:hypothetical protein [Ferruginibacter albus]UAY51380.1 hypothetical protein K9M53_12375 [Ferruginibacter albus]
MGYLLFFIYLLVFAWVLVKIPFIKNAGISTRIILLIFILKVIAGVVNGWQLAHVNYLADVWIYHNEGVKEYHLLFSNPKEYFLNFFQSNYSTYGSFNATTNSYWNDLKSNVMIKLDSLFDILSFGNYYVNTVFYNFIVFFGGIALFRIFTDVYNNRKCELIVACFLLPSLLYFGSSIHKDGLILLAISGIVYHIHQSLKTSRISISAIITILIASVFIFFLRSYILLMLLPAVVAWILSYYNKRKTLLVFSCIYIIGIVVFFNADKINSRFSLPEKVVTKQKDFLLLPASSTNIPVNELQPTFKSFFGNAPQAINHSLMRPSIKDAFHYAKYLFPFAGEVFIYELLLLASILFIIKFRKFNPDPLIAFCLFFALSICLIIGYTIPVIGAVIRYRSIYLPFLIAPVLCNVNWRFWNKHSQIKN